MNRLLLLLSLVLLVAPLQGASLDAADIRAEAETFLRSDSVGADFLFDRTVQSVEAKGALYLVRLAPSGYVVLSGNTAAEPVVAFSMNDYVDETSSPLATLLALADTNAVAAAVIETTDIAMPLTSSALMKMGTSSRRAAKWADLLGTTRASDDVAWPLMARADSASLTIRVKPLMTTTWSQWQPYNDYAPINQEAADVSTSPCRHRHACGCTATAYAQILNYWQWPTRFDTIVQTDHSKSGTTSPFTVRFDGCTAFDWNAMAASYPQGAASGYDLRGTLDESARYPVARLIMCSSVLARMAYAASVSRATIATAVQNNPWYEKTNTVFRVDVKDDATFFDLIRSDLQRGVPVAVTVPGHQLVAHGWAEDADGTQYVCLNYGWGGSDGYFNITEETQTLASGYVTSAVLGHTPIKTVQVEPLPDVSTSPVTLRWQSPPLVKDSFEGYDVRVRKGGATRSTWTEDFSSHATATDSETGIFVGVVSGIDNETNLLRVKSRPSGAFNLMDEKVLTVSSVLTYRYRYYWTLGLGVRIQARFNGGAWEDIDTLPLGDGQAESNWETRQIALGDHADETISLRIFAENGGKSSSDSNAKIGVQLDDFALTDVLSFDDAHVSYATSARSATIDDLEEGAIYVFTVTPRCDGAVASASVQTRIAAVGESFPEISAVTSFSATSAPVVEGLFRECARGTNVFLVACSKNVTRLEARPSHLTLVPDEKVEVFSLGDGQFVVTVDGSGIDDNNDRTRLILTLAASSAGGATAYKDLSLRFSSETTADKPYQDTPKETATSIPVPYTWLIEKGLAAADASAEEMDAAAARDTDLDGYANFAEYLCGTDPNDATDSFKVFISREGDETVISWSPTNALARYTVIGVTNLADRTWVETNAANRAGLRFFRVRATRKSSQDSL